MRFLLLDAHNLFHRASHVSKGNIDVRIGMSLHISIMALAAAWRMFEAEHVVVGLECSNANNWRKVFYEPYKNNRIQKRSAMTEREQSDMQILMEAFTDFTTYLAEKTNVTVLQCPVVEADDMIAHWIATHPNDEHVIISSDKDFQQLLAPNVVQYNGVTKQIFCVEGNTMTHNLQLPHETSVVTIEDTEYDLFEKIIRGDAGDNIFSAFPGVRKKAAKGKPGILKAWDDRHDKGFEWNNFMLSKWTDRNGEEQVVRDRFEVNNKIINLTAHPLEVRDAMDQYSRFAKEPVDSSKIGFHFFKLCNMYNLNNAADHAEEITRIFAAGHNESD